MNNIQLINCGPDNVEVDMVNLRLVLDLLQSLKTNDVILIRKQKGGLCIRV
jgi:hypothetical protein